MFHKSKPNQTKIALQIQIILNFIANRFILLIDDTLTGTTTPARLNLGVSLKNWSFLTGSIKVIEGLCASVRLTD